MQACDIYSRNYMSPSAQKERLEKFAKKILDLDIAFVSLPTAFRDHSKAEELLNGCVQYVRKLLEKGHAVIVYEARTFFMTPEKLVELGYAADHVFPNPEDAFRSFVTEEFPEHNIVVNKYCDREDSFKYITITPPGFNDILVETFPLSFPEAPSDSRRRICQVMKFFVSKKKFAHICAQFPLNEQGVSEGLDVLSEIVQGLFKEGYNVIFQGDLNIPPAIRAEEGKGGIKDIRNTELFLKYTSIFFEVSTSYNYWYGDEGYIMTGDFIGFTTDPFSPKGCPLQSATACTSAGFAFQPDNNFKVAVVQEAHSLEGDLISPENLMGAKATGNLGTDHTTQIVTIL